MTLILNGIVRVPPGELLAEDANDLYEWCCALRRTFPAERWVEEDVQAAEMLSMKCLL